jgi:hypothetical protein
MEILKAKISEEHNNASFYTGIIAYGKAKNGKTYVLRSEAEAEISLFDGQDEYKGHEGHLYAIDIEQMGKDMTIDDNSLDDHNFEGISVLVDGWLTIAEVRGIELEGVLYGEDQAEDRIFGFYDDAIEGFKKFLNKE